MINVGELVAVCLRAGDAACEVIRRIHSSGNLQCVEKGSGRDSLTGRPMSDIQTEADRQSECVVFSQILSRYPEMAIVGEEETCGADFLVESLAMDDLPVPLGLETTQMVELSDLCVFVDPLDGTGEFVSGRLECVSVLIGVSYKGQSLAGIICRPFPTVKHPGICMYGVVGRGAYMHSGSGFTRVTAPAPNTREPRIVTSLRRHHPVMEKLFATVPSVVLREGGAGWKAWLVAVGEADCYAYPRGGTKLWDVLAGDAIVSAIGGVTTDACGARIKYGKTEPHGNVWGIMLSRDPHWHFSILIPASHTALEDTAKDPNHTHWPHGLTIPKIHTTSNL